jgi:hypothetical protein
MDRPTVRIQSDGTGETTVITSANGDPIKDVYSAEINLTANEVNTVVLTMRGPVIDAHAEIEEVTFHCPRCGQVSHQCGD